jgi:hypothetical protein
MLLHLFPTCCYVMLRTMHYCMEFLMCVPLWFTTDEPKNEFCDIQCSRTDEAQLLKNRKLQLSAKANRRDAYIRAYIEFRSVSTCLLCMRSYDINQLAFRIASPIMMVVALAEDSMASCNPFPGAGSNCRAPSPLAHTALSSFCTLPKPVSLAIPVGLPAHLPIFIHKKRGHQ